MSQGSEGMHNAVDRFIAGTGVVGTVTFENMTVFGITLPHASPIDYLTLEEALRRRLIEVTEKGEGGSVPELLVSNPSEHRVLMIQGEGLVGAKQNRVLNASILVDAKSETIIPVSCVEQGRWCHRSRRFSKSDSSHSRLRAMTCFHTSSSLAREGSYRSDQSGTWSEIQRKLRALSSSSPTRAMHDAYRDHSRSLDEYVNAFSTPKDWHGIAVAINGEIVGIDVFDKPATMEKYYTQLIRSFALDAIEAKRPEKGRKGPSAKDMRDFLRLVTGVESREFPSPGLGQDVRFRGNGGVGSALVYEDTVLHFAFFRMPDT